MMNVAAWIMDRLIGLTKGPTTGALADECEQPEWELVELEPPVSATPDRAAQWVGLVCGELGIARKSRGGKYRMVDDPVAQWRVVYRGTPFELLN